MTWGKPSIVVSANQYLAIPGIKIEYRDVSGRLGRTAVSWNGGIYIQTPATCEDWWEIQ